MKLPISVIILTYNESKNIECCLKSICDWASEIFIVDSYSTDETLEIARVYTPNICQHKFETQAQQFNWALDNLPVKSDWIMRLDADERVTPELAAELPSALKVSSPGISGFYVKRRVYFMDRWIRHGGYYPTWLLRIWRKGKARSEEQVLNEHIILLEGRAVELKHDIIDWNHKGLDFWIDKHNSFSARYAQEIIAIKDGTIKQVSSITPSLFASQAQRKRWLKQNFYVRLPLFVRTFLYFIYRYFILLGFLDGKEGLIFHFLHGFWYYFLTDARIYEIRRKSRIDKIGQIDQGLVPDTKKKVKDFWDKYPCGLPGVAEDEINKELSQAIERQRYALEPFIYKYARFANWQDKRVLEIGCGLGSDGLQFQRNLADYYGVDLSARSISLSRQRFDICGFNQRRLFVADAEFLPFLEGQFDFVFCWGGLHHTPDIKKALSEIRRVLKPSGEICVMLYHKPSLVCLQLYLLYGLCALKPFRSIDGIIASHLESPDTKAYTKAQAQLLFESFADVRIETVVTPYDLRYWRGRNKEDKFLPAWVRRYFPAWLGWFMIVRGKI